MKIVNIYTDDDGLVVRDFLFNSLDVLNESEFESLDDKSKDKLMWYLENSHDVKYREYGNKKVILLHGIELDMFENGK